MKALQNYVKGKKFFESVVEDGSDIIFIVDFNGNIHYHNPSVKEVLGYNRNSLVGKNFFAYIQPSSLADLKRKYLNSTQKKYSKSVEFQFLCKDKTYKYLEFNSINLKHKEGIPGLILDCRDITQRKKDAEELLRAQKAKEQFLANISHEIRTPINGIAGIATLLSKQPNIEDQFTYLNAIKTAADNLKVIINDILDLASIESGKLKFENIPFKLSDLLKSLEDIFQIQSKEKGIRLNIELNKSADKILSGDPVRLNQILINLVSNAIKFTHAGSITINVSATKINRSRLTIKFTIEDTGIGIPTDKLVTIFESFSQADASVTRKYGGTGLGLTIVKQLVELQHGTISVESKENVGSKFVVSIPYIVGSSRKKIESHAQSKANETAANLQSLKVLLVEDNDINRLYASSVLKNWGCHLETAENGYVALQKLKTHPFSIILMDIQMPVMDGFETTKAIRNNSTGHKNIPIIALTANATKKAVEKCLAAGMNECIVKPFTPEELFTVLKKYVTTHQLKNVKGLPLNKKNNDKRTIPNLSYLVNVGKGDKTFVNDIVETVLRSLPEIVVTIELLNASCNWRALSATIHKVKPSLTMLGLTKLKEEAINLEDLFSGNYRHSTPSERVNQFKKDLDQALRNLRELQVN